MMDTICRIKDHIIALNSVSYNDDSGLDSFLSDVRETIRFFFNDHSQYMTFFGSISFRPVSVFASPSEEVLCWADAKKQLRELLLVMLADTQARQAGDALGTDNELEEAERIVASHIGGDLATLPRVRIDLRDINILDKRVEHYLKRASSLDLMPPAGPVLFISGRDEGLNNVLAAYLDQVNADVVRVSGAFYSGRSIHEQVADYADARMAIVTLGEDCWLSLKGEGNEAYISSPAPGVCFGLGFLSGLLGHGRVAALYRERHSFRRPSESTELFYIQVDKSHGWRHELALSLSQNKIGMK